MWRFVHLEFSRLSNQVTGDMREGRIKDSSEVLDGDNGMVVH